MMGEIFRMWFEIIFTLSYLVIVWILVVLMVRRYPDLNAAHTSQGRIAIALFAVLVIGDTPHIVARVAAYALGGLDARPVIFGGPVGIVGLGALATSFTLTLFYVLMVVFWRERFNRSYDGFTYMLFAAALLRLLLMAFPGNDWQSPTSPPDWGLYRNLPFFLLGLGVAYLFIRDGRAMQDRFALQLGGLILLSYAFYIPVVLFARRVPLLGMFMLPKTLVYGIVAYVTYRQLFLVGGPRVPARRR
jgi:hypothetical protein